MNFKRNKPETTQVGAISKAQKDSKTKTTFSTTGDNKSSQKTKNWEKRIPNFFWNFFEVSGKSHSAEKCKRGGRFGIFWTSILLQNIKNWWEEQQKKFGKKSVSQCRKKEESLSVEKSGPFCFGLAFYLMLEALDALKMKY